MNVERVIVIGGGIIGCSIAWRLAQRGLRVVVIERDLQPGQQATWAAAGMLHPLIEAESPSLLRLAADSFSAYPAFVQELRDSTGIDAALQLDSVATDSGSVDNRKLGRAVWRAAVSAGVDFRLGANARSVVGTASRFQLVELADGTSISADAVVIAAGAWSGEILGLPIKVPVIPVRGQILAVEHEPQLLDHIVIADDCYLVPRGEKRVLIGATVEHVGFDASTTEAGLESLLAAATRVVPEIASARVVERWAGLRPGTPDDLPVLGADPKVEGLYYATGHFRNGILLAPITATVLSELIATGQTDYDLRVFSIARFGDV